MSRILAIDLGKFKSVTCLLNTETNETEFWTMTTDRQYMLTVLKKYTPDLVVIELSGLAGWVHDLLSAIFTWYNERRRHTALAVIRRAVCIQWNATLRPVYPRAPSSDTGRLSKRELGAL